MDDARNTEKTITQAKVVASSYEEAKQAYEKLSTDRIAAINDLREHEVSWAEIGRIFRISPQAAMYVSGHATRTTPKPKAKKRAPKTKPNS